MNLVDLFLGLLIAWGAWIGWRRGFIRASLFLLTFALSLIAALLAWRPLAGLLHGLVPSSGAWAAPLCFLVVYLALQLVLDSTVSGMVARLPRRVEGNRANLALGVLPGLGSGVLRAVAAAVLLLILPLPAVVDGATRDSRLVGHLARPLEWVEARLLPIFTPAARETLRALSPPQRPRAASSAQEPGRERQASAPNQGKTPHER